MDLKISDLPLASAITGTEYVPVVQGGTTKKTLASSLGGGGGGGGIALTDLSATSPVLYNNTTGVFSIQVANTSQAGYLSASDWNVFNGKGDALTTGNLSQFASTTSAQFASIISDETGTGSVVFANTPTLVTPILGVASATSVTITGTGGAGYVQLPLQSSAPAAVNNAMILYPNASNRFSIVRRNNANSADITHTHIYPDASYDWSFPTPASGSSSTLAGLNTAQTFSSINTFTATNVFTVSQTFSANGISINDGVTARSALTSPTANLLTLGSGFTSGNVFTSSTSISMGANNGNTSINSSFFNFTASNATSLVGYQNDISLITRDNIALAYKVFIRTGDLNNSATVSSGDVITRTGNITNYGATSSTSSGNLIYDVGTVTGSALRGNWQLFGGLTSVGWNSGQRIMFIGNRTASPTGNPTAGYYMWGESGDAKIRSSGGGITSIGTAGVSMQVAGQGLLIKEGTNATLGTATLVGGTITISTTKVTANSRIFVTIQTAGGTVGTQYVSARTAGTSFDITSTSGTDTSTIAWFIVEPN